ncbi:hypothetical protein D6850_09105 [Roseovarius spongiae]|uniref:Uncharacterized protein n=1 Tax=Roseovarius spongiae TaxID=2320272 RepID=A0A3A8AVA6_9RHOB|nr:hypothetical protein [Roseovarius spongiae]RKF15007.1 hypothetical protein D6850_09105 [Roseovarius spongiae]
MTLKHILAGLLAAAFALSACAKPGERVRFDGNYYPAKAKKAGDARENFVVSVRRVGQGIEGARAAAAYEGTRYCIKNFGDSTITWQPGADPADGALRVEGDALTVRGSCVKW